MLEIINYKTKGFGPRRKKQKKCMCFCRYPKIVQAILSRFLSFSYSNMDIRYMDFMTEENLSSILLI